MSFVRHLLEDKGTHSTSKSFHNFEACEHDKQNDERLQPEYAEVQIWIYFYRFYFVNYEEFFLTFAANMGLLVS